MHTQKRWVSEDSRLGDPAISRCEREHCVHMCRRFSPRLPELGILTRIKALALIRLFLESERAGKEGWMGRHGVDPHLAAGQGPHQGGQHHGF